MGLLGYIRSAISGNSGASKYFINTFVIIVGGWTGTARLTFEPDGSWSL